jgi:bifunctional UDP-N-acetylglucosamine pyrophosphorylase/glucosamine-1-phosphate N-acetyltransferase
LSESRPAAVIVLAAGEGTRMKSATPKVLHMFLGRSMLGHVLVATAPLDAQRTVVVVGQERDQVVEHLATIAPDAESVEQVEQNGTGHALRIALDALPDVDGTIIVVCGDTPLLTPDTLKALSNTHTDLDNAATVLTARVPNPHGYGRMIRDDRGEVIAIVEQRDADEKQQQIDEINSGIYAFDAAPLRTALATLTRANSQGEEYLTDVVATLRSAGSSVGALVAADHAEILGVNDRVQLATARQILRDRINEHWMRAGVNIVDPATTIIGASVRLQPDSVIHPWTLLEGTTTVAAGAEVGPGSQIIDSVVDVGAIVRFTTADRAQIGRGASVGPYTYLRPGTILGPSTRAGAFVETKNAQVGEGSKVPHLSYVGDAEIGEGSNIGAATVFVNYDGVAKHRTVIGDQVRIGSDTMLVAPLVIGDGAYTAAGSVITDDVPPGAIGVGRAKQRTIEGWVARKRPGSASAAAAAAAEAAQQQTAADSDTEKGDNGTEARTQPNPEGHVE